MKRMIVGLALALLSGIALAAPSELTFCTGGPGGAYEALGQTIGNDIAKKTGATLVVENTGGSVDNAAMLKDGDCVMAIMQADAVTSLGLPRDISVTDAHTEAVFWIHGLNGIKTFAEMAEKKNLVRGVAYVAGSGAEVTLKNFASVDEDYAQVKLIPFDDWYSAAEAVNQGFTMRSGVRVEVGGLLYVGRPGFITDEVAADEFRDNLLIGEIGESSFSKAKDKNENQLYTPCKIDNRGDSGIKTDNSWSDITTYCQKAQVVYNNAWHTNLEPKEARTVKRNVSKAINTNVMAVRQ